MNQIKRKKTIVQRLKALSWKGYVLSGFLFVLIGILLTTYFTNIMNSYLDQIFINQSINLAESYALTIDLSNVANNTIDELMEDSLNVALHGILNHFDGATSQQENIDRLNDLFQMDEIFIYDEKGVLIASKDSAFIGFILPPNHPVKHFQNSDLKIQFEPIREASETKRLYKYGYLKTEDNYIIQVGISADRIYEVSRNFLPQDLMASIADDDSILFADIYIQDETNILYQLQEKHAFLDPFEKEALESWEISYRYTDVLQEKTLQIFVPIMIQNQKVGTLILYHSTVYHQLLLNNVMLSIVVGLALIVFTIIFLLWLSYLQNRNIQKISYFDVETGINNKASFIKYTADNFQRLRKNNACLGMVVLSNFAQLRLLYDEENFKKITHDFYNFVLGISAHKEKAFLYYDDVIILIYEDEFIKEQLQDAQFTFFEQFRDDPLFNPSLELKFGVLNIDDRYTKPYEINANVISAIVQVRDPLTPDFTVFTDLIWDGLIRNERLLNDLRRAYLNTTDDEFFMVYQPQIDRRLNRVVGFEALSRWTHPQLGPISPKEFISVAERSNIMIPLGDRIIDLGLAFLKELIHHGYDDIRVSINISYAQLQQSHFNDKFLNQIRNHGVPHHLVGLEVTESMFIDSYELANQNLDELRQKGVKVYLDDFGMAYSTIDRMNLLNLDYIKIDQSFVRMIDQDPSVIEGVIALTKGRDVEIIAEGVEHINHIKWLENQQCTIYQGFYYSPGLKKEDAIKYLQENYHPDK